MSKSDVIAIIERALDDETYRNLLFTDPDQALQGYNLTADEKKRLSNLNADNFDEFAGPLTGRTTKGQWIPGG
jgi:hypothetical protein